MKTTTRYTPARPRRRRVRGLRAAAAVALIGAVSAGCVTLDAMTPAQPRPVVAMTIASAHHDARLAAGATRLAPHPTSTAAAKKHHILRKLLAPLRLVRHVHRFFRIARNPFSLRRWFW